MPEPVELPRGPARTMPVWRPETHAIWTGWDDAVPPQCRFEALRDWQVEAEPAVTLRWESVRAPFSGDHAAGRLSTSFTGSVSRVRLTPARSLPVVEPVSTLEVVVGSRRVRPTPVPPPKLRVVLGRPDGSSHPVDLEGWLDDRWTILRARLPTELQWLRSGRLAVEAIEVLDWIDASSRELWFGAISLYAEDHSVFRWSRSDRATFRVGRLVDSAPRWDPPTPGMPPVPSGTVTHVEFQEDTVVCTATGPAGRVAFRLRARQWQQGCEIGWNERWHATWKGIAWSGPAETGTLESVRAHDRGIELRTSAGVQVSIRPYGYSVWIGIRAPAGALHALHARGFETASQRVALDLPLLSEGPRLHMWRATDAVATPMFATGFWDPFVSQATRISFHAQDADAQLGRVTYEPTVDGQRPSVQDAFVLTVAPDVLAVIPNVPVTTARRAGDAAVAWYDSSPSFSASNASSDWPITGPSFRLVEPAATLWTHAELDCLDPRWRRTFVRHAPDGSWVSGRSPGSHGLKVDAWARLLSSETEEFAIPNAAVVVRLTERLPWELVDFDPRSDGAGTWAAVWREISGTLRQGGWRQSGVVLASSRGAWWYADSADAAVLSVRDERTVLDRPWLPLWSWYRLHQRLPVMGPRVSGTDEPEESRRLATTLAYGFALRVSAPAARAWRPVARMAALQRRQALSPLDRIAWNDGRHWLSPSDALVSGAWETGWLYLRYVDGLEIWVNGSSNSWTIQVAGDDVELPAWGWRALGKDFSAGSARLDFHCVDWVRSAEYLYHDGHGSDRVVEGLGCALPVVGTFEFSDRQGQSRLRLRFPERGSRVVLAPPLWFPGATLTRAVATDREGRSVAAPSVSRQEGNLIVGPSENSYEIRLEWTR